MYTTYRWPPAARASSAWGEANKGLTTSVNVEAYFIPGMKLNIIISTGLQQPGLLGHIGVNFKSAPVAMIGREIDDYDILLRCE